MNDEIRIQKVWEKCSIPKIQSATKPNNAVHALGEESLCPAKVAQDGISASKKNDVA